MKKEEPIRTTTTELTDKKKDWGKIGGWIVTGLLALFIVITMGNGEFKKWKDKLRAEGAQIQQANINTFIVNQLKTTGALRIMFTDAENKQQEILLRPVQPEAPQVAPVTPEVIP